MLLPALQAQSENCLPFGLSTALHIFNLFAEALHWVLQAYHGWDELIYYLDDFVAVLPARSGRITKVLTEFAETTTYLGFERKPSKDRASQVVDVLGIEIDNSKMIARLSDSKKHKAYRLVTEALSAGRLTKADTDKLSGYLSFCSSVVVLGRTFLRRIWDFNATFTQPQAYRPHTFPVTADLSWWSRQI
jgi:hypothetical protein